MLQYFIAARMTNDAFCRQIARTGDRVPAELQRVQELLGQGLDAARRLMERVRSIDFAETPLPKCLASLAHTIGQQGNVVIDVQAQVDVEIDEFAQLMLYRIAQEAIANVVRHSGASKASVTLVATTDERSLRIHDNGTGFDPTAVSTGHFGLRSIRERAAMIGGRSKIDSNSNGTALEVEF